MIISIEQWIICNAITLITGVAIGITAEYRRQRYLKKVGIKIPDEY